MTSPRAALESERAELLALADCPIGLFMSEGGELCLKTEYGNNEGRIDAYIVSSGEFFWGSHPQTIANQRKQLVTPIDHEELLRLSAPVDQAGEVVAWPKRLADNWRGRRDSFTGDAVRDSCADELENVAAKHTTPQPVPGVAEGFEVCREALKAALPILREYDFPGAHPHRKAVYKQAEAAIASLRSPAAPSRPVVSIIRMGLSDGRTDYFVSIKVGDRKVTPHVFREEFKAAYHVALYDWLLNGTGEEPGVVEFGPDDWPAKVAALPRPDAIIGGTALCGHGVMAAICDKCNRPGDVSGVREALMELEAVAEKQKAYFNAKQHEFPCIEDCTDEDGKLSLPDDIAPLLHHAEANGRYSEADWWLSTIRSAIAKHPDASNVSAEAVQDTYLVGGPADLMAMSGSVESDRVIQLHFRRRATDRDREWLLEAINLKIESNASVEAQNTGAHLRHCNQGEYLGSCKYGDDDCPTLTKSNASVEALEQRDRDIGILLANIRFLEDTLGESLEDEDASMVRQIEREHKDRSALSAGGDEAKKSEGDKLSPKKAFDETFSAETVLMETFFSDPTAAPAAVDNEDMPLQVALAFADTPRSAATLEAPADTMEELRGALRVLAKAYRTAASAAVDVEATRCPYCDDTGDVHRADGEWLGRCDCKKGAAAALKRARWQFDRLVGEYPVNHGSKFCLNIAKAAIREIDAALLNASDAGRAR